MSCIVPDMGARAAIGGRGVLSTHWYRPRLNLGRWAARVT